MKHYHKNPRKITRKQMDDLKRWLVEFGDLSGIVHNIRTDEIIGGNQRSEAIPGIMSGLVQPVITERFDPPQEDGTVCLGYYDIEGRRYQYRGVDWDDAKSERANLIANKAGGSFDFDILANEFEIPVLLESGFTEAELIGEGFDFGDESKDAEPQIDRAAELLEKWQVKTGDLWKIGEHRLICGDSLVRDNVNRLFGGELARLTWTDPPYGVKYGDKMEAANPITHRVRQIENDNLPADQLEDFIRSALKNAAEFSVAGAAIYVACPPGTLLPALIASFAGSGFDFRWGLVWLKDQIVLSRADYHFKHENILYGWKPDGAHYFTGDRTQASVFEYPRPKVSEEHPTMKPVELVAHMIRNSSERGDIVYDAFGGSGSTMLACENEGRVSRMVELSPAFVSVILERMNQAFPELEITRITND